LNPGTAEEVAERALRGRSRGPAGTEPPKLVEDTHDGLGLGANLLPEVPQDLGVLLDPQDEDAAHLLEVLYGGPRFLVLTAIQLELALERLLMALVHLLVALVHLLLALEHLLLALEHPLLALEQPLLALEELTVLLPTEPHLVA
jgi:hypothetical protein